MKKTAIRRLVLVVAVFFVAVGTFCAVPEYTFAQSSSTNDVFGLARVDDSALALPTTDIRLIIARVINIFLGLLGLLTVILIMYAGYLIMTANGNDDKVTEGKTLMRNAVIGLAIIISAFSITQFIISRLSGAVFGGDTSVGVPRGPRESFSASGALGRAVRDHYPLRNEREVPRNTRIVVTFRSPVRLESLATERSGNATLGDCRIVPGQPVNFATDCDQLSTSSVRIFQTGSPTALVAAAFLAVPDPDGMVRTIVLRPLAPLGSSTTSVSYTVDLTRNILAAGSANQSIFAGDRGGHYEWQFDTSTVLDQTPPFVTRVSPRHEGEAMPRNGIVQIDFSEPVDPTAVQGVAGAFTNIIFGANGSPSVLPTGSWQITNGYRSVEFISDVPCGRNSCGREMYCLPTTCVGPACGNSLSVLVRTAEVLSGGAPFEAVPFTGVADLSGNALDSGSSAANPNLQNDGRLANPHKPPVGNPQVIGSGERVTDNFFWNLRVSDVIDRTAPYIFDVQPEIDAEGVVGDAPVEIVFGVPLRYSSLDGIALEEYPVATTSDNVLSPPWYRTQALTVDAAGITRTQVRVEHRELGPDGSNRYYFVSLPSTIESQTQNCFYPGRGPSTETPGEHVQCVMTTDAQGQVVAGPGCAPTTFSPTTDTACIQTTAPRQNGVDIRLQPTVESCVQLLRGRTISPQN